MRGRRRIGCDLQVRMFGVLLVVIVSWKNVVVKSCDIIGALMFRKRLTECIISINEPLRSVTWVNEEKLEHTLSETGRTEKAPESRFGPDLWTAIEVH